MIRSLIVSLMLVIAPLMTHVSHVVPHTVTGHGQVPPGYCWNTTFTYSPSNGPIFQFATIKEVVTWCPNGRYYGFNGTPTEKNTEHKGKDNFHYCVGPFSVSKGFQDGKQKYHWQGYWFFTPTGTPCYMQQGKYAFLSFTLNASGYYTYKGTSGSVGNP